MHFSTVTSSLAAAAFISLTQGTFAQGWSDNFDSYSDGDLIEDVSLVDGWEKWSAAAGNSVVADSTAPNPVAHSALNSLCNTPGSDTVNNYGAGFATSGRWVFQTMTYVPSGFTGESFFIMLNTYNSGGPYDWSVQVGFNGGTVACDCGGNQTVGETIINDAWIPMRAEIDLNLDTVDIFYDGASLTGGMGYSWTGGVFGGGNGLLEIQALDLFPATNPSPMYYDSMWFGGPLGAVDPLCTVIANSSGLPALLSLTGTDKPGEPIEAQVTQGPVIVPGQFGYFIGSHLGGGNYFIPPFNSEGFICVASGGGAPWRWQSPTFQFDTFGVSQSTAGGGPSTLTMDGSFSNVPASMSGETWAFQAWFRDMNPGATSNFSESKLVTFP